MKSKMQFGGKGPFGQGEFIPSEGTPGMIQEAYRLLGDQEVIVFNWNGNRAGWMGACRMDAEFPLKSDAVLTGRRFTQGGDWEHDVVLSTEKWAWGEVGRGTLAEVFEGKNRLGCGLPLAGATVAIPVEGGEPVLVNDQDPGWIEAGMAVAPRIRERLLQPPRVCRDGFDMEEAEGGHAFRNRESGAYFDCLDCGGTIFVTELVEGYLPEPVYDVTCIKCGWEGGF